MTQELTHAGTIGQKIEWAKAMAPSSLLPKAYREQPANLLLAAEYADALGIERINALTSIHVIEGKPTLSADLMVALARRAGHKVRVQVKDGAARATLVRADDPGFEFESVWTIDRAKSAGLAGKSVWKSYPQAMLRSRAVSEVVRQGASEVLSGAIYTPEEVGAPVDQQGIPTEPTYVTAEVTAAELLGDDTPTATTSHPDAGPDDTPVVDAIADDPGDVMTARSRGEMFALFDKKGADSREKQLKAIKHYAGVEVESRGDLTEQQALDVINGLRKLKDAQPEPDPEHLTDEAFTAAAEGEL